MMRALARSCQFTGVAPKVTFVVHCHGVPPHPSVIIKVVYPYRQGFVSLSVQRQRCSAATGFTVLHGIMFQFRKHQQYNMHTMGGRGSLTVGYEASPTPLPRILLNTLVIQRTVETRIRFSSDIVPLNPANNGNAFCSS